MTNAAPEEVVLETELDIWIRLKLAEWDADSSGQFSRDEVAAAMDELRGVQQRHRHLKQNFIFCFAILLVFLGAAIGAVAIVITVNTELEYTDGDMRAPMKDKPNQKAIIETTPSREVAGLTDLLDYDDVTDQWLIEDQQLRFIDQVSFTTQNGDFYNFDLSEIVREDMGAGGTNDKVHMLTTGGHKLRLFEQNPQLEIQWAGQTMWESVEVLNNKWNDPSGSGGRRLNPELYEEFIDPDVEETGDSPPRRMFTKGGVMIIGPRYHGHGGGGGGSRCRGHCNVPHGSKEPCRTFCNEGACYDHKQTDGKIATYQCSVAKSTLLNYLVASLAIIALSRSFIF